MQNLLVIKHASNEGSGTIGDYFRSAGWNISEISLYDGGRLPASLDNVDTVICMGGPMNVYQEDRYPFLKDEDIFIKNALKAGVPFIGFCLGAQLLAKALGAKVKKAPIKEIGWGKVILTPKGIQDPLLARLPREFSVFQWHEDTFGLPSKGTLIAESISCKNQAFRFGRNAYGLQFHVEVTPEIIESWVENANGDHTVNADLIMEETKKRWESLKRHADIIYENFINMIGLPRR